MKKAILYVFLISLGAYLIFLASCGSDDEFEDENTFNLDSLIVNPSQNIGNQFQVIWEVSTTGFPQFLIEIYLSDDATLDANDILLAETADTDTNSDPSQSYVNGLVFRMTEVSGGTGTLFEFSYDQTNWEGETVVTEDLSGQSKYIIGRFFHVQGLQIDINRSRMAVEVSFQ